MKRVKHNREASTGDRTMIYQKPITREEPEGIATLVVLTWRDDIDGLNRWRVRFDEEPDQLYDRAVFTGD